MLSGAAHARESYWELAMARRYNRDKNGRFASKGGGGGGSGSGSTKPSKRSHASILRDEQRAHKIGQRVARTATRKDEAAMGRLSQAAQKFRASPTAVNKSAWLKASKERDATFKAAAQTQGRARKAAERKFGLTRRGNALVFN